MSARPRRPGERPHPSVGVGKKKNAADGDDRPSALRRLHHDPWACRVTTSGSFPRGLATSFRVWCGRPVSRTWVLRSHYAVTVGPAGWSFQPTVACGWVYYPPAHLSSSFAALQGLAGSRLAGAARHPTPSLGFCSLWHMRLARSGSHGRYLPATFRPQGLATLSTVYSLACLASLVSGRQHLWDSPFGAFSSRKVATALPPPPAPHAVTGETRIAAPKRDEASARSPATGYCLPEVPRDGAGD